MTDEEKRNERRRWSPIKRLVLAVVAFCGLASIAYCGYGAYVFSGPEKCTTCHFIKPYYDKWKTSTHSDVACTKCHEYSTLNALSGQLRFILGTYNPRPMTTVPDKNCLQSGCHEGRLSKSKTTFSKRGISFDHEPHFNKLRRGQKLHCRSCHSDIVQGEHVKVSQNVCFLCHFKDAKKQPALSGCPLCHDAPKDDIVYEGKPFSHKAASAAGMACKKCHVKVVEGNGEVPKDKCFFCHIDRVEKRSDVKFVHDKHVTEKELDCLYCHDKIKHGKISTTNLMRSEDAR